MMTIQNGNDPNYFRNKQLNELMESAVIIAPAVQSQWYDLHIKLSKPKQVKRLRTETIETNNINTDYSKRSRNGNRTDDNSVWQTQIKPVLRQNKLCFNCKKPYHGSFNTLNKYPCERKNINSMQELNDHLKFLGQ